MRRHRLGSILGTMLGLAGAATGAAAQSSPVASGPITIGDVNSFSSMALFTEPYRRGAELAVEEFNAVGGAGGRPMRVIFKDDAAKPGDAIRQAEELVGSDKVSALAGGFTSSVCLALADFAQSRKLPFVCGIAVSDAIAWEKGNAYTFHTAASTYMQAAMLAEAAAKLPAKTWATVAPNYEYGTSFVARFKELLLAKRPDVKFVAEQWPALGKIEPGSTIDALMAAQPDAIFNAVFGTDLVRLVREANTRSSFKGKSVLSGLTGQPEYLDSLKEETPVGWIVTGYPWQRISTAEHDRFLAAYKKKYDDYPRWGSVLGYVTYQGLGGALKVAGSSDPQAITAAFKNLKITTPVGPVTFREDHQATLTVYLGTLAKENGNGVMVDIVTGAGETLLPPVAEAMKFRPATR